MSFLIALSVPIAENYGLITWGMLSLFDGVLALAFVLALVMAVIGVSQK
jgi:hypothetical protein